MKNTKKNGGKIFKKLIILVLFCFVFNAFYSVGSRIMELNSQNDKIKGQIAEARDDLNDLKEQKANMHSDENYLRIAKKTLGLVEPGDKVYINTKDNN